MDKWDYMKFKRLCTATTKKKISKLKKDLHIEETTQRVEERPC
jgi:hypothetical protein